MKIIHTQNSTYEVDVENRMVRRVSGTDPIAKALGEDGKWVPYMLMVPAQMNDGDRYVFYFKERAMILSSTMSEENV